MRKNIDLRLSKLIGRCRQRHHFCERGLRVGNTLGCSVRTRASNDCHRRLFSTKTFYSRKVIFSFTRIARGNATWVRAGTSTLESPRLQRHKLSSRVHFSSTAEKDGTDSWNARVTDFLARTLAVEENEHDRPSLRPGEIAETIQTLLDDLLNITAAAVALQKGEHPSDAVSDAQSEAQQQSSQYLDWMSLSSYSSSSEVHEYSQSDGSMLSAIDEYIDVGLAFALMDRLVTLEQAEDSTLINHTLEWTAHTKCLNPILQLWNQSYGRITSVFTPSEVLAKLDTYRQQSNLLVPDVQSYNIIMDAVATQNISNDRKSKKSSSAKDKHVVDIDFCQSLWEWMWKESNQDSLLRPDEVTLRIMLKAHVYTGHALAAQRCETLVDEWSNHHNGKLNNDKSESNDGDQQTIYDPKGTLLQSLIHVWALHDPDIAESYLKELAWRYLTGMSANPPDTIAWNRVISAYAIAYNQPKNGLRVLEDFWDFYRKAHGLDDATTTTVSSDEDNTADSASINTKSNSLKLSNSIAISNNKEEAGIEELPKAMDSAIWKVHQPNLQTYNALLEGFARQNNSREANKIFERVQNAASMTPDIATYTSAIKANKSDLNKVNDLAQECLTTYQTQQDQEGKSSGDDGELTQTKYINLDRPFFHGWLHACANAGSVKDAKKVKKQMKQFDLIPNATTYRLFTDVFLSRKDSQGAIEWLLAYAKLEGMSESAVVSCTTHLLDWYRNQNRNDNSGDVDSMVLLQILCENDYITQEDSLQQLLLRITPDQAKEVLGWLRRQKGRTSLKMWAITIRGLAQEGADTMEVEDFFLQLQDEPSWSEKFDPNSTLVFDAEEEKLITEIYSSIIVAWSRQGKLNRRVKERIQHWENELATYREGSLSLNLAAQVALVTMYCNAGDPRNSEKYVVGLFEDFEDGKITSPPDTIMCNMVLNAWARKNNGSRAAAFFEKRIKEPDAVSYNTVINAFAKQGQLEEAEKWASALVNAFIKNPVESIRPQQATFTVLLAAWRRSKHPDAGERAEKILKQMHQLHDDNILLDKPNSKSYQTVLDTWEKSNQLDAAMRAEELLLSSSDHKTNKKLLKKVRYIKSRHEKRNHGMQSESKH